MRPPLTVEIRMVILAQQETFCLRQTGTFPRRSAGAGTVFRLNVVPVFQAVTLSHSTLILTWSTVVGWKYQLQCNPDLSPTNWNNLNSPVTATGATFSTTALVTDDAQCFCRVMILP
jgi:hypothetical protein